MVSPWSSRSSRHLVHHYRFYVALLIGVAVAAMAAGASGPLRLIAAGDAFFAVYLVLIAPLVVDATPDRHRDRASYPDEGVFVVFLIIAAVIAISFAAVFALLKQADAAQPAGAGGFDPEHSAWLGDVPHHRRIPLRAPLL